VSPVPQVLLTGFSSAESLLTGAVRRPRQGCAIFLAAALMATFFVREVGAESVRAELRSGFLLGDVAARWGAPHDRREFECARSEEWDYRPGGTLRFHEGRLTNVRSTAPSAQVLPESSQPVRRVQETLPQPSPSLPRRERRNDAADVNSILNEIMETFPPGKESGGAQPPSMPPAASPLMGGIESIQPPDGMPFSTLD
jgi:hypothetical protein